MPIIPRVHVPQNDKVKTDKTLANVLKTQKCMTTSQGGSTFNICARVTGVCVPTSVTVYATSHSFHLLTKYLPTTYYPQNINQLITLLF